jgi:hypothetical protein
VKAESFSDRDLLRALALGSNYQDWLVDADHDCDDLFASGLIQYRRDFTGDGVTDLTEKGRNAIRDVIHRVA